jgi:hypothetical protein
MLRVKAPLDGLYLRHCCLLSGPFDAFCTLTIERVGGLRSCTNLLMQVIAVAQPPTKMSGSIISGVILPCRRRKIGHFEW